MGSAKREITISGKLSDLPRIIREAIAALRETDRESSCGDKVRHNTQAGANSHATRLNARKGNDRQFEAYRCRYCKGWHVGGAVAWDDERAASVAATAAASEGVGR